MDVWVDGGMDGSVGGWVKWASGWAQGPRYEHIDGWVDRWGEG